MPDPKVRVSCFACPHGHDHAQDSKTEQIHASGCHERRTSAGIGSQVITGGRKAALGEEDVLTV